MSKSIYQRTFYGLSVVLLSFTGIGVGQEAGVMVAVPAPDCSGQVDCPSQQASIAVVGGAMIGRGQVEVMTHTTRGMNFGFEENAETVKNQPYQAEAVTEVKQTLADGSHISQTTTATVARDSDGKTVRIQKLSTIGPWKAGSDSSQANSPTLTIIFDPVAKTHTDYTSDSKVAHVLAIPAPPPGAGTSQARGFAVVAGGPAGKEEAPIAFALQGHAESVQLPDNKDAKTESLGNKSIEGVPATGTRETKTIPVGAIGNDKDLAITRETWYSPDLKLVLQSTQTDPRFGETTYSLTNIQRNEPDPSLFQVPAGYKVEKVPVVVKSN
jgi:hypothetical protein